MSSSLLQYERIILRPRGGAELNTCIEEALHIAINNGCDVEFAHNDRPVKIDWKKIFDCAVTMPPVPPR